MLDLHLIPIEEIRGLQPKKIEELHMMGIFVVANLLEYAPYRYEDYQLRNLIEVTDGERVTIEAVVMSHPILQRYSGKSRLSCKVMCDHMIVTAVWFNRHYLKDRLTEGTSLLITGKWDAKRRQITVSESEQAEQPSAKQGTLQAVYSVTGSITQKWLRHVINQAFVQYGTMIQEILPQEIMNRYQFMSRSIALQHIHQPVDGVQGGLARQRMVYEELFLFQLKLQAFRTITRNRIDGIAHVLDLPSIRSFVKKLPFQLTDSQKKVIAEILDDMKLPVAMNRLLQGDVGSGKTIVAAVALFAAVRAGYQGALLVPTEILAEQHFRSLRNVLEPYQIQVELLTGSVPDRQRKDRLAALQMGIIHVLVGTHALIQEDVYFRNLSLVVTDEQHRFGVQQRSVLRQKGINPDVLAMTATPIPRTLAISVFGDMDVSTISELPKGRIPIRTYHVSHRLIERVYGFIEREVNDSRQVYVICPLIEESEKLDVQNAIDMYIELQQRFAHLRIGLLHGRMSAAEKESVKRDFKHHDTQILVSTTVIEVGVDVPNASLMIVYDADRFGLSQLHQLRGRVGRGPHQSHCVLIADPKSEFGKERLKVMTETTDGFEISRRDLELRGPGDFFGTKQSGIPDFQIANLVHDYETMEQAREDASALVVDASFWTGAEYSLLRDYLQREHILVQGRID
jgi:ATP-dependent DNA helicase RecG